MRKVLWEGSHYGCGRIKAILKEQLDNNIRGRDEDKIAEALGENTEYFLREPFEVLEEITFCSDESVKEQEKVVNILLQLLENMDEVISAKGRFLNISKY